MRLESFYLDVVKKIVPDLEVDLANLDLHKSWVLFTSVLHPGNTDESQIEILIHRCSNYIAWLAYKDNCTVTESPEDFIKQIIAEKRGV